MLIKTQSNPVLRTLSLRQFSFPGKKNVKVEKQELYGFLELKCLSSLSSIE